ncbi:MAG: hypothetical protein KGL39_37865, partial [Patescibacteria group bacterium]|nr:hypothetical protein [Patescibacteria group bacterium]
QQRLTSTFLAAKLDSSKSGVAIIIFSLRRKIRENKLPYRIDTLRPSAISPSQYTMTMLD